MNEEKTPIDLAAAKKVFSRIGFSLIVFIAVSYAVVFLLEYACLLFLPKSALNASLSVAISSVAMYGIGVPVFYLLIRKITPEKKTAGKARFSTILILYCITTAFMYFGSIAGQFLYDFLGDKLRIYTYEATLEVIQNVPWYVAFLFAVILAPIFEELVFRKLIIERVSVYGEKLALLFSAVLFAFFHMSVQQFFYAFLAGLVFGYLYIRTRKLIYPVILHALVNFFGSVVPLLLMEYAGYEELLAAGTPEKMMEAAAANPVGYAVIMIYSVVLLALVFGGLALTFVYSKKLHFDVSPMQLPRDSEATVAFTGIGVILFIAITVILPFVLTML